MTRSEYMRNLREAWESGKISTEAYDAGVQNADIFCDEEEDE